MSKRNQIALVAVLAAAGIAAPAVAATQPKKVASEVEVAGFNFGTSAPYNGRFVGDVHSNQARCERNRKVRLYHTSGGERQVVGTDRTDRTGDWVVILEDKFVQDDPFDATVARRKIERPGRDIVCKADESPPLVYDPVV